MKVYDMVERIEQVLGKSIYTELKEFMRKIATAEDTVKILSARRCLVLYRIFFDILKDEDPNFCEKGIIISNLAAHLYVDEIRQKGVAVYDDVLIHGHTMITISQSLTALEISSENIEYNVYVMNDAPKINEGKLPFKCVNYEHLYGNRRWKDVSNRLVRTIHIFGMPYVSYALPFEGVDWRKFTSKNLDYYEDVSKKIGDSALCGIIFFKENSVVSDLSKLCLQSVIRRYAGNKRNGRMSDIYVPLVNLREHKGNDVFLSLFDTETSAFLRKNIDADSGTYTDRVVSCLLSKLLAEEFTRTGGFSSNIVYDDFFIQKSLGEQAAKIILQADTSVMRRMLRTAVTLLSAEHSNTAIDDNRMWLRTTKGSTFQKLCVYIKEIAISAKISSSNPSRSLENLCEDLGEGGAKSSLDIIWSILRLVEQGAANFKVIALDDWIFTCLSPGEQNFRCMDFIDSDLVQCLYILSDYLSLELPDADKDALMYKFTCEYLQEKKTFDFTLAQNVFHIVFSDINNSTYEDEFKPDNITRVDQYITQISASLCP